MTSVSPPYATGKPHFVLLDGLRGVAASGVVVYHSFSGNVVPNGFLAVDLFFLLSGFVIAYSYRQRLLQSMTLSQFAIRRVIRLYPVMILGTACGLVVATLHNVLNPAHAYPVQEVVTTGALSAFLLPSLSPRLAGEEVFPLDTVLWSLFFEVLANIAFAAFPRLYTRRNLAAIVALGFVGTVWGETLGGNLVSNFWLGFPRVAFGFFGGILLYDLWEAGRLPNWSLGFGPLSLAVLAVFAVPHHISGIWFVPAAAAFCMIIVLAANNRPQPRTARIAIILGEASYPVYVLHLPLLYLIVGVSDRIHITKFVGYPVTAAAGIIAIGVFAWLVVQHYEKPVRRALTVRLVPS
jgi:peptidoglycan/LPS O-acetylase OafA/YrhL